MKTCILRGVPSSLRQDGWWLGPISPARPHKTLPHAAQNPRRYALHALFLATLIAVAQLPWPATDNALAAPYACGTGGDLGFHAADGLRSLGATPKHGTIV